MKKLFFLFLLAFLPLLASADAVEIDGIYYNLVPKAKVAEVTSNPAKYSGDIVIPEKVTYDGVDYDVTTIGERAFFYCNNLKSLGIPGSIITINNYAFCGCNKLSSISIPNSVSSLGNSAFDDCTSLVSITIPNSVTSLGHSVFKDCVNLTSVALPNGITELRISFFERCSSLSSVSIPDGVQTIGKNTFDGCGSLTSVIIPNSVSLIDYYAFRGCTSLTTISLNKVSKIYTQAFENCINLSDLYTNSEKLPFTGDNVFKGSYPEHITLHVPEGCVDAYKAVEPWSGFKEIVSIAETKYNLTYLVDGEVYKTYQLKEGETITPEPAPSKENCVFSGWSEIPETMPAYNVEITGSFSSLSNYDEIKIGTSGINSFSSSSDLDFTNVEGLKAYIASGYNDDTKVIWLMRVYQVPANTGLLVKGTSGGTYHVPHQTTHSYYSNMLRANTGEEITLSETDGDMTNYYLKSGKLLSVNESATIGKNKSYLQVPTKVFARTRSIGYVFGDDDGTTALPRNIIQPQPQNDVYYNLQGQRVKNLGKGLYIKNGRKVVIK